MQQILRKGQGGDSWVLEIEEGNPTSDPSTLISVPYTPYSGALRLQKYIPFWSSV